MRFTKMHGIGNDYIYVNGFEEKVADPAALARRISDRYTGVGADGLILVLPPDAGVEAHVRMKMFNADGSRAEMCGNGIRCVCKLVHDHGLVNDDIDPMRIQTDIGVLNLQFTTDAAGKVEQVTVDMGEPILQPTDIPVRLPDLDRIVNHSTRPLITWPPSLGTTWELDCGFDHRMTCVSMGNPHAVFYCDDVAAVPLETIGPILENHRAFPNRVNVHFVQVQSRNEARMRTWERGSGLTRACGTGASAVCVAGVLTDRTDRRLLAHLPGGDLLLEWNDRTTHVYMTGPATEVFRGDWKESA